MQVTMLKDFTPRQGTVFLKGESYRVHKRLVGAMNLYHSKKGLHVVPNDCIVTKTYSELIEDGDDAWSYISDTTGIKRQTVENFFVKYWDGSPIPQICLEERLRAQDVVTMIACFNKWAGDGTS